ncbi:hypothetical protein [uncultured Treponema sp.]|uniref:hypothetical protein n=1 Tax=uncultured Treponema sp. TaxID=162155 RepID=UPI002631E8C7|nr:hypothetical protein [uncultured Treponema sp.]
MEFDKNKVYTAANADEVKVGSKGFFADSLAGLRSNVFSEYTTLRELTDVYNEHVDHRFETNDGDNVSVYNLFYLVEEPQEKQLRPYKDTDEMIDHFCRHFNLVPQEHCLPIIWIKRIITGVKYLVVRIGADEVTIVYDNVGHTLDISELEDEYTYLDGSPCGIEE